jgi:hypothetical protein
MFEEYNMHRGVQRDRSSCPGRVKNFLFPRHTDYLWGPPTSCPMGTEGSFLGGKAARREADHSPPASADVKKMWIYISTFPYAFTA